MSDFLMATISTQEAYLSTLNVRLSENPCHTVIVNNSVTKRP